MFPDGVSAQEAAALEALHEADTGRTSWDRTEWTLRRAARTRQFWLLFALAFTIMGIVEQIAIAHQVYFYRDAGYSALSAAGFYSAFGVAFIIGNLVGSVSDRVGRERMFVPACLVCAASACSLLLDAAARPWLAPLFAVVFGLTLGSGLASTCERCRLFHGPTTANCWHDGPGFLTWGHFESMAGGPLKTPRATTRASSGCCSLLVASALMMRCCAVKAQPSGTAWVTHRQIAVHSTVRRPGQHCPALRPVCTGIEWDPQAQLFYGWFVLESVHHPWEVCLPQHDSPSLSGHRRGSSAGHG